VSRFLRAFIAGVSFLEVHPSKAVSPMLGVWSCSSKTLRS
jgi:hypothetical protein